MKYAHLAARLLLGLGFTVFGASGFAMAFGAFSPPPPPNALAGEFFEVFSRSRWLLFVDAGELVGGVLLLADVYVPLALCILGAILANILVFHLGIEPEGIAPGLLFIALWIIVAMKYKGFFRMLLTPRSARAVGDDNPIGLS